MVRSFIQTCHGKKGKKKYHLKKKEVSICWKGIAQHFFQVRYRNATHWRTDENAIPNPVPEESSNFNRVETWKNYVPHFQGEQQQDVRSVWAGDAGASMPLPAPVPRLLCPEASVLKRSMNLVLQPGSSPGAGWGCGEHHQVLPVSECPEGWKRRKKCSPVWWKVVFRNWFQFTKGKTVSYGRTTAPKSIFQFKIKVSRGKYFKEFLKNFLNLNALLVSLWLNLVNPLIAGNKYEEPKTVAKAWPWPAFFSKSIRKNLYFPLCQETPFFPPLSQEFLPSRGRCPTTHSTGCSSWQM